MELKHKGKTYELVELKEPITNELFDIIAIFETRKDGDFWELGDFVNYFYGASVESEENIKSIALDYIKEYELSKGGQTKVQDQNDQPKQPQTTTQKKYKRVLEIINKLGDENNEQDTCELVEELENLLPFKNKREQNKWVDLTTTFKCWEDWESATLDIAQRLNK